MATKLLRVCNALGTPWNYPSALKCQASFYVNVLPSALCLLLQKGVKGEYLLQEHLASLAAQGDAADTLIILEV